MTDTQTARVLWLTQDVRVMVRYGDGPMDVAPLSELIRAALTDADTLTQPPCQQTPKP